MEKEIKFFFSGTNRLMTLKHGMLNQVLKFYQDCSFDDPGLTLIFFMARSYMGNAYTFDFMESFEYFGLKIGNESCLNEYTKIYE